MRNIIRLRCAEKNWDEADPILNTAICLICHVYMYGSKINQDKIIMILLIF